MKKYVKPDLVYENYELSHNVANCSLPLNHGEKEFGCSVNAIEDIPIASIFTEGVNCEVDAGIYEDICKFTGSDGYNVFTS